MTDAPEPAQPPPLVPEDGDRDVLAGWTSTIRSLFDSGHHKWGFLVYRTSYEDDAAWANFMRVLNGNTDRVLENAGKLQRLHPYLRWTPMEDPAYDGASKDDIRDHFRRWVDGRSVERDGPGADRHDIAQRSPRYRYCFYVDKAAMQATSMQTEHKYGRDFHIVKGHTVIIDSFFGHRPASARTGLDEYERQELDEGEYDEEDLVDEEDQREWEPIEGRTSYDVGWMYVEMRAAPGVYERLAEGAEVDEWPGAYKRPPEHYPRGSVP